MIYISLRVRQYIKAGIFTLSPLSFARLKEAEDRAEPLSLALGIGESGEIWAMPFC